MYTFCTFPGLRLPCGRLASRLVLLSAALLGGLLSGCAAVTNPAAEGVEVRKVPLELLGQTRELPATPLDRLGQEPPDAYVLAAGDTLGVWIEGVLGERGQPPPILQSAPGILALYHLTPAVGFPLPVRENGTLDLPLVEPVRVAGLTLPQAEAAIRQAYIKGEILRPGRERIIVSLFRPREYTVVIVREDAGGLTLGVGGTALGTGAGGVTVGGTGALGSKRGTGAILNLPAYENDVLHALAQTGGLPGLEAQNEVIVMHGRKGRQAGAGAGQTGVPAPDPNCPANLVGGGTGADSSIVRIPLRQRPGQELGFRPEDVILQTGDTVYIPARDTDVYYTGGLLPAGEFVLPRDYDVDVVTVVARTGYDLAAAATGPGIISASLTGPPIPSQLTVLRRTCDGGQVPIHVNLNRALRDPAERILIEPGDVVILQETLGEALTRYFTTVFRFNFTGIARTRSGNATLTTTANFP